MADPIYSTGWDSTGDGRTGDAAPQQSGGLIGTDPQTAGRVRGTRPTYGGYTSTVKVGPDGKLYNDPNASGSQDAVNRYRSLGEAAAGRGAYQVDYSDANAARDQAYQARDMENDASGLLRGSAMGRGPTMTTGIGQGMTDAQLQGQLAGSAGAKAFGTRGSTGLASASMAAQMQAAGMGVGNASNIAGMRAGETNSAMGAYSSGLGAMRGQDYSSMGLSQHQAIAQGQAEMAQRQRNSAQQMGYEGLAFGVNQAATNASMATDQADEGFYSSGLAIDNAEKNRALKQQGATVGAIGGGIASFAPPSGNTGGLRPPSGGGGGGGGGIDRNNPYGDDDSIDRNNPY